MKPALVACLAACSALVAVPAFGADPSSASGSAGATAAVSANAETGVSSTPPSGGASESILAGAKVGGIVPFGGLSTNVSAGIEVGYIFPFLRRSFALAVDVDFSAPKKTGSDTDPRLGTTGGTYSWELTEQQLAVMPIVMFRLHALPVLTPYAAIGPRIYMLRSKVHGEYAGNSILETTEQSTKVGIGVPVGVEYVLGPGALVAELLFQYGGLDHTATGSSNTGGLSLSLGYRFLL